MTGLIIIRIFLWVVTCLPVIYHPIHVSVTSLEYLEDEELFSASFKIFTDDFEAILFRNYGVKLKIDEDPKPESQIPYFNRYISESFYFIVNEDKKMIPLFERKKVNEEAVWLYYSFKCSQSIKSVRIHNALMMDMFDDQTNLLIFKYFDLEKGYRFKKSKMDIQIEIDP